MRLSLQSKIKENLYGMSSFSGLSLSLIPWREWALYNIVFGQPDLRGSELDVYLKYDTGATSSSNRLKLFNGQIKTWKTKNDVMYMDVKNVYDFTTTIPKLFPSGSNTNMKLAIPFQYGDFGYDDDYSDIPFCGNNSDEVFAICPMSKFFPTSTIWQIAYHEMKNIPTAGFDVEESWAFVRRSKMYAAVDLGAATWINASSGAYVEADTSNIPVHLFVGFSGTDTSENQATVTNGANAIDEDYSTEAYLESTTSDTGDAVLILSSNYLRGYTEPLSSKDGQVHFDVYLGDVSSTEITTGKIAIYDGTSFQSVDFAPSDANSKITVSYSIDSPDEIPDLEFKIIVNKPSSGTSYAYVKEAVIHTRLENVKKDEFLYVRCKGRKYSGTWDGRKTPGDLITNPIDALEAIFRDDLGMTDVDTDRFDDLDSGYSSVIIKGSYYEQVDSMYDFFEDYGRMFGFGIHINSVNKVTLLSGVANLLKFSSSGTSNPGDADKFMETDQITDGEYQQNPIKKRSFQLSRISEHDTYSSIMIFYFKDHDDYNGSEQSSGTDENVFKIYNYLIPSSTQATNLLDVITTWFKTQKTIARFETFYDAIDKEVGDVINIRHSDLDDDMLDDAVSTQKWMILYMNQNWRPNVITIKAIEMITK